MHSGGRKSDIQCGKITGPGVRCGLCPRNCPVDRSRGEVGFCGMDGRLKIARAALHYWEEPCISGTKGSGTVFFSGCNLRCVYCQNYQISACKKGKYITGDELADIFIDLQRQGAHNINLVTPTHFVPQIYTALEKAREKNLSLPIVYNCGGYENPDVIPDDLADIYLIDFKYFDNKYAKKYSSAENYCEAVKKTIAKAVERASAPRLDGDGIMQSGVIVRHLTLPGLLFDSKKIIDYLYAEYGNDIVISIMNQYTPLEHVKKYPELYRRVNEKCYEKLVDYAVGIGVENAYIQTGDAAKESFIPEFFGE